MPPDKYRVKLIMDLRISEYIVRLSYGGLPFVLLLFFAFIMTGLAYSYLYIEDFVWCRRRRLSFIRYIEALLKLQ
jgi:hypothetical protein